MVAPHSSPVVNKEDDRDVFGRRRCQSGLGQGSDPRTVRSYIGVDSERIMRTARLQPFHHRAALGVGRNPIGLRVRPSMVRATIALQACSKRTVACFTLQSARNRLALLCRKGAPLGLPEQEKLSGRLGGLLSELQQSG